MTSLASKICAEVQISGAISFARFMEMSLYYPELGYYERQEKIGRHGDFYTSVSVGALFGELLAFQFAEWFEESEKKRLRIIEAGAHDGQLARDILNSFKKFHPQNFEQIHYCILEPSLARRDWQQTTLAEFSNSCSWMANWSSFSAPTSQNSEFTIIFSNELFDAMPVHRLGWNAKTRNWFEWGVGWDGNNFVWKRLSENPTSPVSFPEHAPELLAILPDEFTIEICPAAVAWWKDASSFFQSGKLLAIDYGLLADEFFTPQRSNGTLRAYHQHHANLDLLARPGEQDITAHANFSALKSAGENAGLKTEALVSQGKFLTQIASKAMSRPEIFGEWNQKRAKQFQTLTHPEHFGRSFRALVQSR